MIKFKSNTKRMSYQDFLRKMDISDLLHEIEMATYQSKVQKMEVQLFRTSIEAIALQCCRWEQSAKFKAYLQKGY